MTGIAVVVFVTHLTKPPFGFAWELRRFAHSPILGRSKQGYRTHGEAYEAGQLALRVLALA